MKKKVKRSKILIVGGFTIDEIQGKIRPGGPLIYSSLGVMRGGGIPKLYGLIGRDFDFEIDFISDLEKQLIYDEYTIRFKIDLTNEGRKLILLKKPKNRIKVISDNTVDGILVNPVCKEVDNMSIQSPIPIAVDIQGFVRNCIEYEEIRYEMGFRFPFNSNYMVMHGNREELESSKLELSDLFKVGFKEIIVSDGHNGFNVYTNMLAKYTYRPSKIGKNEIGTGDFLLGAYFALRLGGLEIIEAATIAGKLTEEFSNSEFLI
ncbi:carbohydrate kinase family protein [Saccharolobus solfataricus]|uniref:carbohydrate kinase family protein n=1 Tax=Saccharolobus solfataricus TaxID=2287 RepID=UPI003AAEC4A9